MAEDTKRAQASAPEIRAETPGYEVLESSAKRLRIRIDTERTSLRRALLRCCAAAICCAIASSLGEILAGRSFANDVQGLLLEVLCASLCLFVLFSAVGLFARRYSHVILVVDRRRLRLKRRFDLNNEDESWKLQNISHVWCLPCIDDDMAKRQAIPDGDRGRYPHLWRGALVIRDRGQDSCFFLAKHPQTGEGIVQAILNWSAEQGLALVRGEGYEAAEH